MSLLLLLQMKETASRMLTNFSVQAGVNDFYTAQRVFKESSAKVLPQVRQGLTRRRGRGRDEGLTVTAGVRGHTVLRQNCCTLPPFMGHTDVSTCCS